MQTLYQNNTIRIRPYRDEDVEQVYLGVRESLPELKPYMVWTHDDYSISEAKIWCQLAQTNWLKGIQYSFIIEAIETDVFLGAVGLRDIDLNNGEAILGYWVHSHYTQQGIAKMAVELIKNFAKEQLNLYKLVVHIATENKSSQAVINKFSVVLMETKPQAECINQRLLDCYIFEMKL